MKYFLREKELERCRVVVKTDTHVIIEYLKDMPWNQARSLMHDHPEDRCKQTVREVVKIEDFSVEE